MHTPELQPLPEAEPIAETASVVSGKRALDWGAGEALAFASLVSEGIGVRVSGQDSAVEHRPPPRRVARHENFGEMDSLQNLKDGKALPLNPPSESAVLHLNLHSVEMPEELVIWEAQFGDFANGAQVIIDQFISSSKTNGSGLTVTLLLPHGFEGQGPEHSSARLERFLTLSAQDNMRVMNLTTPAQLFHALRRQVKRGNRKPLVVMTPKSLLRHPRAVSSIEDLAEGCFEKVLKDTREEPAKTSRILLCSGKVTTTSPKNERNPVGTMWSFFGLNNCIPTRWKNWKKPWQLMRMKPSGVVQEEPLNMGLGPTFSSEWVRASSVVSRWNVSAGPNQPAPQLARMPATNLNKSCS